MSNFHGSKMNPKKFDKSQIKFYLILIPMAVFMGMPIVYIFSHALKPMDELFAYPPKFFVKNPSLDNFRELFKSIGLSSVPVSRFLFNSLSTTLVVVLFTLIISSGAAYALSKKKFKLKDTIFEINTMALMFVSTAVVIPRYLVIVKTGLIDSYWAHIFPVIAMPVGVFLIKQFIDQIPDTLIEAAKIDGAKDWVIFTRIILPLIKPALATIAILSFQTIWNSTEASSMFIHDESLKTFAFYLASLGNENSGIAGQGMIAAASLIMFLPNFIIFVFMQSKVMDTMAHSGIK